MMSHNVNYAGKLKDCQESKNVSNSKMERCTLLLSNFTGQIQCIANANYKMIFSTSYHQSK